MRSLVQPPAELSFDDEADLADRVVQSFLARVSEVRRIHVRLGPTDEESWHARLDRQLHGTPGLRKKWWVELAFSGKLVELGLCRGALPLVAARPAASRAAHLYTAAGTLEL